MKNAILLLFLFFSTEGLFANPVEFSAKEKSIIYTNSLKLIQSYQSIINEIGVNVVSNTEKAKSNAENFNELFINRQVLVHNDLDPTYQLSKFYEVETYSSNLILWYPDGININLDMANAKVSEIIPYQDNVYSIDILVNKKINGNYLNKTLNKNTETLTFRVAFSNTNGSFDNFKIVGIRNAKSSDFIDYTKALKEVNSEDFSKDELLKVHGGLKSMISDYENFLALLGNPNESDEDKVFYIESFLKLFKPETKIYNDISPEKDKSLVDLDTYLKNYKENYPAGIKNISLNVDSADFGKVIKSKDDYYSFVYADKFFSGSYKGKEVFREMFPLAFKISFVKLGSTYTDFKINSIDISGKEFYTDKSAVNAEPTLAIKPVTRKGFSVSVYTSFGLSSIDDKNINGLSLAANQHEWGFKKGFGSLAGVGIHYYFSDNFSISSGMEYSQYKSTYTLNGTFQDDALSPSINTEFGSYNKIIIAKYDSTLHLGYLNIHLLIKYSSGAPGKFGFYIETGVLTSILFKSSYENSGSFAFHGYFPNIPAPFPKLWDETDGSYLGFYKRENISNTGTADISNLNISFCGSFGVNIPLGYYSSITVGPEIAIGFSDINGKRKSYKDIFGNSIANSGTKITKFGVKIGFVYKL